MRNIYFVISGILFLSFPALSLAQRHQFGSEERFLKGAWGMAKESVKRIQNFIPDSEDDSDMYGVVSRYDNDCAVDYRFYRDKLYAVDYIYNDGHQNLSGAVAYSLNSCVEVYNQLKEEMISDYGKPHQERREWEPAAGVLWDSTYCGFYVSLGYLTYSCTWSYTNGTRELKLFGGNHRIKLIEEEKNPVYAPPESPKPKKPTHDYLGYIPVIFIRLDGVLQQLYAKYEGIRETGYFDLYNENSFTVFGGKGVEVARLLRQAANAAVDLAVRSSYETVGSVPDGDRTTTIGIVDREEVGGHSVWVGSVLNGKVATAFIMSPQNAFQVASQIENYLRHTMPSKK